MLNSHLTMFNGFVRAVGPGVPKRDVHAQAMRGIAEQEREIEEG